MIRPRVRRVWLVVAAVLVVGSIAAAVALQLVPDGSLDQRLPENGTAAVALHPNEPLMVWSKSPGGVACDVAGDGLESTAVINAQFHRQHKLRVDGETWYGIIDVRAWPAATYEMSCSGAAIAVGEAPWLYRAGQGQLIGPLTFGLSLPDLLLGLVILPAVLAVAAVVRFLRRRRRPA